MKSFPLFAVLGALLLLPCCHAQAQAADAGTLSTPDTARAMRLPDGSLLMNDRLPSVDPLRIPSPYSYQRLGIFCKAEVKMNAWFPMPVMIRMGDVEKAEELDGKGAFRLPH